MGDAAVAAASPLKRRCGDGMRRVAEILMVLAAAGEARGGREPTAAERVLAAEARERLAAAVAEGAARPRDLFQGEAVRAVVEDLGLNRANDPAALGFRPPKASIADRLTLTKRKVMSMFRWIHERSILIKLQLRRGINLLTKHFAA